MTQTLSLRKFFAVSAFAAAASVSLFSTSGTASASVLECKGNTAGAVLACCQEEVKRNGKPMWMRVNQSSCTRTEVTCRGQTFTANIKRCWYKPTFAKMDSDDKGNRGRGRGQGGKP